MKRNESGKRVGRVYLVGAGPGDPALITVKGLQCLKRADTVVYDRLAGEELLRQAKVDAELIYAGKSPDRHALSQQEINQLLARKAAEGKVVVRLKGGDPFVLGRGGEEAECLTHNGIPFEVVPGITSAIAVPAYAGIPVTHRSVSSSFAVITGHEAPNKENSAIKWEKLATGVDTLVFLMAMANLPQIVAKLLEHGRPPETPVAIIKDGTCPDQKTVSGRLDDITKLVEESGLQPPAVMVVGDVVRMGKALSWFENRPLSGKRVLVTRARHQASKLSQLLAERGAIPIELPAISIKRIEDESGLDKAISSLRDYHWIVFTSVNGVQAFFERLDFHKLDSRAVAGLKVGAIGPATAESLRTRGIAPEYVPTEYTGRGFIDGLSLQDVQNKRFLILRADIADREIPNGIHSLGGECDEVHVYSTLPDTDALMKAVSLLEANTIDIVTFTSSSTVTNLVNALGNTKKELLAGIAIACIGPKTAQTAKDVGLSVAIGADESTIIGLANAIEEYFAVRRS